MSEMHICRPTSAMVGGFAALARLGAVPRYRCAALLIVVGGEGLRDPFPLGSARSEA